MAYAPILPDRLAPDLRVWFVGTAAGRASAMRGAYYAHPGNRFWRALHEAGITPERWAPEDFPRLLELGIGLTDFCKTAAGQDSEIPRDAFDIDGFKCKAARLKPQALAFTSKKAASLWLGRPTGAIALGRQPEANPAAFVLPSPSGLAVRHFSMAPWLELGDWLKARSNCCAPSGRG